MRASSLPLLLTLLWQCSAQDNPSLRRRLDGNDDFGFDLDSVPSIETRIVGGSTANGADYEFHVNLGGCGATLIAPDVILTAAHCRSVNPTAILIGGSTYVSGQPRTVAWGSGTPHPYYRSWSTNYDLMLYKLTSPSTMTPAPLNNNTNNPSVGDVLTVLGFGATQEDGEGSFSLRSVDVNAVSYASCNLAYVGQVRRDSMFCAAVEGGGKDSCQGDSGGPMIDQNGVLVGVTSWGNGCGKPGYPGVYARISNSMDWILQTACQLSDVSPDFCDGIDIPDTPTNAPGNSSSGGSDPLTTFWNWITGFFQ